ncbi:MAG: DNA topoisomerase (ATP-hydrolyzing) subunit A [Spirochaetes bacterium]|nr:DNA topoisomerase (ATP-hydrolyzing) subunit A [Spirochaetota bacterium]
MAEKIIERFIEEEMKVSYLNYAMSVIVSRALPDVRDGLKPVHRRILYAMHRLGMAHSKPYKKSATVVGEVLGKYHPHGDQAIYETLVRLAQSFSLRYLLIQGQGNFGSIDGDTPAAMRYTECRLERISDELLKDIDKETIDWKPNFDDSLKEPDVMPAAFPNLLVNGVSGIAVGMATNMAPHNLREVVAATIYCIDHRDCTVKDLMQFVKGPDFPTRGIIHGIEGVREAYETGRGMFKVRGRVSVEDMGKGREALIITEIPYMVNKADMIVKMANLVKEGTIVGIGEIRDESDKDGIRVVIELKRDAHTQTILNQLYKHTPLEDSFSINQVALVAKSPKTLNLKELIHYFIEHRFEVQTRRIQFDLARAEERAHILEGLIKAVLNIDEVVRIIRGSESVDEAKDKLIARFAFSEIQAKAILDMRLSRLVALEIQKLEAEFAELQKFIAECKDLLANPPKIYQLIKDELTEIAKAYGDDRRTEIVASRVEALEAEAYIQKANVVVAVTKSGYIKRTPANVFRQQGRGGVGVKGAAGATDEDVVSMLFTCTTHDLILFVTNKGKAYYLKAHELPEASRTAKGTHIKNLLGFGPGEDIQSFFAFANFEEAKNFLMVTRGGIGKKSSVGDFINAKRRGVVAIHLKDGDTLVGCVEVKDGQDVIVTTRRGQALRTSETQFREMGRGAGGVRAMTLETGDEIIGVDAVEEGTKLLVVSEKGYGKKIDLAEFGQHHRGGKGQIYMKTSDKTGEIAAIRSVKGDESVLVITSAGNIIRLSGEDVKELGRPAQGVRLVAVQEPDMVVDAAVIRPLPED